MLFWLACEELSQETNKSVVEEKARVVYEDYISILSPKEVQHLCSVFYIVDVSGVKQVKSDFL